MKKKRPVVSVVPATHFKQNFGEVIRRVYEQEEILMIERAGMPVAFLTSVSDFEQTHPEMAKTLPAVENSARRQQAAKRLRAVLDSRSEIEASEEEVDREVLKAVYAVRYGKQKKQ